MALPGEGPQANIENVNLLGKAEPRKTTCKDFPFTKKALMDPGPMKQTNGSSGLSRVSTKEISPPPSRPALLVKSMAVGLSHTSKALAAMPINISNALALGFRNTPRLYGDQTVHPPPHKITGARSGLRAARSELFL